ncbi:MAG: tetratricopeptide repeat protein [Verrucomicrobia bacterium]|nr:tetratricopeptide repeat protein [Verrucomicrobiota bacterium]
MTADQLLKEGRLDEALKSLQTAVRDEPASAKLRIFLFQLLSIVGDWKRALTQLHVLADMDSDSMMLARVFEPVLRCEAFRNDVFAGKRTPIIFGQPPEWIGYLIQAMEYFGKNEFHAGIEQRNKAFDVAPASSGKINGQWFEWIADADERLGPVLEVILDGKYYWVPFCRIKQIVMQPVSDLRDLAWTPAQFVWENGGEAFGHIPSRYPGSEIEADSKLRLAKKTEWRETNGIQIGLGQRLLATDADEYPLLEVRTVEITPITSASPVPEVSPPAVVSGPPDISRPAEISSDI